MRLTLKPSTESVKFIMQGRARVGQVIKNAKTGKWTGKIGAIMREADNAVDAFEAVAAKHMGFDSADDVRARNSAIRAQNKMRRNAARDIAREYATGNTDPFYALLDKVFKK